MRNNPNVKTLAFIGVAFALCAMVMVSDMICGNIFGATISLAMLITMCFSLGYIYNKFEKWNAENGVDFKLFDFGVFGEKAKGAEENKNLTFDDLIAMAKEEAKQEGNAEKVSEEIKE